jgi:hypothetical protein
MSEQTNVPADANAESQASGDIDAQLAEMQTAETQGTQETPTEGAQEGAKPEGEKPEVKKVVPLAALHEERRERQRLQNELAEQRRVMDTVNKRLEVLMTPRPQVPNPNENFAGYIDHRFSELAQQNQQTQQALADRQQREDQQRQIQALASQVINSAAQYAKEAPDFHEAVGHLNTTRARELMALGVPEVQAAQQAQMELDQAAMTWAAQGQNPAQIAYEFAKARGYAPKQAQQTPQEKIATQQKGMQASRSLGSGGAAPGKLTAQALADMSDEEFANLSESDWRKVWRT